MRGKTAGDGRYLTSQEKAHILAEWQKALSSPYPRDDAGGRGWPDPDVIPLCDALNRLPGVCTVQSCAGHGCAEKGYVDSPGQLWLRLDEHASRRFKAEVFGLATAKGLIERVCTLYTEDGKEITVIEFYGNERDLLPKSAKLIVSFFERILNGQSRSSCNRQRPPSTCIGCRVHRWWAWCSRFRNRWSANWCSWSTNAIHRCRASYDTEACANLRQLGNSGSPKRNPALVQPQSTARRWPAMRRAAWLIVIAVLGLGDYATAGNFIKDSGTARFKGRHGEQFIRASRAADHVNGTDLSHHVTFKEPVCSVERKKNAHHASFLRPKFGHFDLGTQTSIMCLAWQNIRIGQPL